MNIKNRLNYYIALIAEFGKRFGLSNRQSFNYLQRFQGLDFVERFYDVEHTLSFDEAVDDVASFCRRNGGELK